jgi:hypothetical protein
MTADDDETVPQVELLMTPSDTEREEDAPPPPPGDQHTGQLTKGVVLARLKKRKLLRQKSVVACNRRQPSSSCGRGVTPH